jgi:hypothetical protein
MANIKRRVYFEHTNGNLVWVWRPALQYEVGEARVTKGGFR